MQFLKINIREFPQPHLGDDPVDSFLDFLSLVATAWGFQVTQHEAQDACGTRTLLLVIGLACGGGVIGSPVRYSDAREGSNVTKPRTVEQCEEVNFAGAPAHSNITPSFSD